MTRKAVVLVDVATRGILDLALLAENEAAPVSLEAAPEGQARLLIELLDDAAIERAHSGDFGIDPQSGAFVELPFKALLLGAGGILEDVVELAGSHELTDAHVDLRPHGGDCDNEPGKYRWDAENEQLVPLKKSEQRSAPGGYSLEDAFADFLESNPQLKQGSRTMVWLAGYRGSVDGGKKK